MVTGYQYTTGIPSPYGRPVEPAAARTASSSSSSRIAPMCICICFAIIDDAFIFIGFANLLGKRGKKHSAPTLSLICSSQLVSLWTHEALYKMRTGPRPAPQMYAARPRIVKLSPEICGSEFMNIKCLTKQSATLF